VYHTDATIDIICRIMYNHLTDKLVDKIDRTRSDVKKIAANILNRASEPTQGPAVEAAIPFHPRREDYPLVKHWTSGIWKSMRHPKKGTKPERGEDPTLCLFWEDALGQVISLDRRRSVLRTLRTFWQGTHNKGVPVNTLTNIGLGLLQEYRTFMENEYPWLRLCEDHWKADQIWINNFTAWTPATPPKGKSPIAAEPESIKRTHSVDEMEAGPSKRPKTIGEDKPLSSRPKPTRIPAKVRLFPPDTYTTAKYIQANPL
jgi:hypothetical protein